MSTVCLIALSSPLPPEAMEMKYVGGGDMNSHYIQSGNFPTKLECIITKHLKCHKCIILLNHFNSEEMEKKKQDPLQPYLALIVDSRVSVLSAVTYMQKIH